MLSPASRRDRQVSLRGVGHETPLHLLVGPDTHGVTRYAREVAAAARARVVRDRAALPRGGRVHLHLTDRLFGPEPAEAAAVVEHLARRVRLTVTLHDVPQPSDGPVFAARAEAYGRIVLASHAWATNSWHEHALVDQWSAAGAEGTVIPLPVPHPPDEVPGRCARAAAGRATTEPVVGVFGFVYPGKGHRQVVRAVAALRRAGILASVRILGDAAPGHADEVEALVRGSRARGVPVEVTGRVPDPDLVDALRGVAVGVTAHRNVSASGSLNSWIAAGRRPLVRDGAYAREMAALRPGTIELFDDATLVPCLDAALRRPVSTWTSPAADLGPRLEDTAAAYRAWWASVG